MHRRMFLMKILFLAGIFLYLEGSYQEFILPWSFFMQTLKACLIAIYRMVTTSLPRERRLWSLVAVTLAQIASEHPFVMVVLPS